MAVPVSALLASVPSTTEDITIPVDYNDGSAVDPTGVVFYSQSDVDNFLSSQGASNFKHLQLAYEALPDLVSHLITFELAAGVHLAHTASPTTASFDLSSKVLSNSGAVVLNGADPTNWTEVDVSLVGLSVTGAQLGSGDPYLDFSGTPFATFDLKGNYVVLSTGQTLLIHDHTDSRLFVTKNISPDPTGGTATVATQSTILRASFDDVSPINDDGLRVTSGNLLSSFSGNYFQLNHIELDMFGVTGFVTAAGAIDTGIFWLENFSIVNSANGNLLRSDTGLSALQVSILGEIAPTNVDLLAFITATSDSSSTFDGSYFRGSEDAFFASGEIALLNSVMDRVGESGTALASLIIQANSRFQAFSFISGKTPEFRGVSGVPGIRMEGGATIRRDIAEIIFSGFDSPCLDIRDGVVFDISQVSGGMKDGGSNTDVGFEVTGPRAFVSLNSGTDVSGSAGDVRFAGSIESYADIESDGPFTELIGNVVEKAP